MDMTNNPAFTKTGERRMDADDVKAPISIYNNRRGSGCGCFEQMVSLSAEQEQSCGASVRGCSSLGRGGFEGPDGLNRQKPVTLETLAAYHKKSEMETFLDALGWPWNKKVSRELDHCIKTIEADDGRERD